MNKDLRFTHVVISGGSLRCLAALGGIMYHEDEGHLEEARTFVGTSAGAILAFLLAVGFRTREVVDIVSRRLLNHPELDIEKLLDVAETYGIDDGQHFVNLFQELLAEKLDISLERAASLSFSELEAATGGKRVVVCVTNVTKRRAEYWGVDTHPTTSVATAVRASMGIPLIFTPVEWHDCLYVDGGLLDNFPVACVPRDALATTLAVNIVRSVCTGWTPPGTNTADAYTLFNYLQDVFETMAAQSQGRDASGCTGIGRMLCIPVEEPGEDTVFCFSFQDMRFAIDDKSTERLVNHGYGLARASDVALSTSSESRESAA